MITLSIDLEVTMKDSILKRRSVRTYDTKQLSQEHEQLLMAYCNDDLKMTGPLGSRIRVEYIKTKDEAIHGKIGTYGIIKNAPGYLLVFTKNNKRAMFDLGFVIEKLVLYLGKNNLSTCWLGGTYNLKNFSSNIQIESDEFMPIILPIGYSARQLSLTEKIMRRAAKSDNRLDHKALFFDGGFNTPVVNQFTLDELDYIRKAPSASNKQPWRLLLTSKATHFYISRTPGYSKNLGYDVQILDIGIAYAHYSLVYPNSKAVEDNPGLDTSLEYVISALNI